MISNPHTKKIVVIGPESTGKSTLSAQLAAHYHTVWVPEYAREYLEKLDRPYRETDLAVIAKGQMELEDALVANAKGNLMICDTDLYVLQVWSQHKYGRTDPWILEEIAQRRYTAYILCDIDMTWQYDPLREHPDDVMRRHFFEIYYRIVTNSHIPYQIVRGSEGQRQKEAIGFIDRLLNH